MYDENSLKKAAQAQAYAQQAVGRTPDICNTACSSGSRPSLREEAEKSTQYHFEQAHKASAAADFLRDHPEFDEFVGLIRSGALQF